MNFILTERQFEFIVSEHTSKSSERLAIDKLVFEQNSAKVKVIDNLLDRVIGRSSDDVEKIAAKIEANAAITSQLEKELNSKSKFNLQRTTSKTPRTWDYQKEKISDNLEFIGNPKGSKGLKATIMSIENPKTHEYIHLKKDVDNLGEYYFMSAKMSNPIDAGRAFKELIKRIPKGSRFGEPVMGSLSTDSFYNLLRRVSAFEPKVVGYVKLNNFGSKRFQELVKKGIPPSDFNGGLLFKTVEDAKPIQNALDGEIKKVGLNNLTKLVKDPDTGMFNVMLPNIQLIVK